MTSTVRPLRRLAVTLALTGATAFGGVAIAPAALADESVAVTEAPVTEPAPVVETPVVEVPVVEAAPVVETPVVEVPVVEAAPVVEAPAVPAPVVVTPLAVVIGKDGKPVKAPKVCTTKDLENIAEKVAQASQQALTLTRTADKLQVSAAQLRAQALTAGAHQTRQLTALAGAADWAAALLDQQAAKLIERAGEKNCFEPQVPGGRF